MKQEPSQILFISNRRNKKNLINIISKEQILFHPVNCSMCCVTLHIFVWFLLNVPRINNTLRQEYAIVTVFLSNCLQLNSGNFICLPKIKKQSECIRIFAIRVSVKCRKWQNTQQNQTKFNRIFKRVTISPHFSYRLLLCLELLSFASIIMHMKS